MSPELPDFIPRKLVYRPAEVANYLECSRHTVLRKMKVGEFGELKRNGGSDQRPRYKITYDGLLSYYRDLEDPLKNRIPTGLI